eukprot:11843842-Ditylum_brightwellii.AAC.1
MGLCNLLEAIGHPQQPTKIKTNNKTANSFSHASMYIKRSKSWDMQWHWLREATTQKALEIFWDKGLRNGVDYFTKHHPSAHHRIKRKCYILKGFNILQLLTSKR